MLADGRFPALEETLTIRPQPRSAIAGAAARIARSGAITFSSQAAYQSDSGTSSRSRQRAVPALLTSTSRLPKASSAAASDALAGVGLGDVEGQLRDRGAAACGAALLGGSGERLRAAGDEQHRGALGGEHARRPRPIPRLAPVIAHARPPSPRSTLSRSRSGRGSTTSVR